MGIKKLYYRFLYHLTKNKKYQKLYKEKWGKNNKLIIIDENGVSKEYPPEHSFKGLDIHWFGSNNTFTLELPVAEINRIEVHFKSNNNNVHIGKRIRGRYLFVLFNDNNNITFGNDVSALGISITLNSADLTIGNDCMISTAVNILTDGHSIIDKNTKELINKGHSSIEVGNHVWLGYGATLLKNAKIRDNCIVGTNTLVTKAFEEENVVIAGNPAKIVRRNITWDKLAPVNYEKFLAGEPYSLI